MCNTKLQYSFSGTALLKYLRMVINAGLTINLRNNVMKK